MQMKVFRVDFYDKNGDCVFTPFIERESENDAIVFAVDKLVATEELVKFEVIEFVPAKKENKDCCIVQFEIEPARVNKLCFENEWMEKATQKDYAAFLYIFNSPLNIEAMEIAAELMVEFSDSLKGNSLVEVMNILIDECSIHIENAN